MWVYLGEMPEYDDSFFFQLFVSRYCSKLPGDRFTRPKPVYTVEEFGKDYYICKLQLPLNCQLRENILVSYRYHCPLPIPIERFSLEC